MTWTRDYALILLMMLRLRRVVRIVHGLCEIKHMEDDRGHHQLEKMEAQIERLKAALLLNSIYDVD